MFIKYKKYNSRLFLGETSCYIATPFLLLRQLRRHRDGGKCPSEARLEVQGRGVLQCGLPNETLEGGWASSGARGPLTKHATRESTPPSVGVLDLNSSDKGCARQGSEVAPPPIFFTFSS